MRALGWWAAPRPESLAAPAVYKPGFASSTQESVSVRPSEQHKSSTYQTPRTLMAYTVQELYELVKAKAAEAQVADPAEDIEVVCKSAADSLGRGPWHGLQFLQTLHGTTYDAVSVAVLQLLCDRLPQEQASVRAQMLLPGTMGYILRLMGDTGAHAPSVRVAGVKLLCCLIGGQQAQTLESFMTPRCLELVMQYLKAGTPLEWVRLALEVVVATSNCSS